MIFSKKILIVSMVVIIVASAASFILFKSKPCPSKEASDQDSAKEAHKVKETPLPVRIVKAARGDLVIKLKSPGEAATKMKINMKAEVAGVIKSLKVEESQHVKKGDLLVELDDEHYRLDLEQEEATRLKVFSELLVEKRFAGPGEEDSGPDQAKIKKAKEDYEKARGRFRSRLISKSEFEKAGTEYELALIESGEKKEEILAAAKGLTQAEIRVKTAQMNLEKTRIRAPFSGIIHDIKVSHQEHVTSGRELFTLVNIDRICVEAKVLESEIGKIKAGREVDLKFSAYPGKIFKGEVKAISPVINPEDKTCKVMIDVANPEEEIKPGMHVEVEIAAEIHKDRLLIPQDAVLVRSGRKLAFVVEEGLAKWRYIDVGLENEDFAEVLDGVKEGESVIVEGHFTLAHDARVRVQE
jgi:RND family efflux transporter MFP subunit